VKIWVRIQGKNRVLVITQRSEEKTYFLKNEDNCKKMDFLKILAHLVENCGSQGKKRF
jgi:hypothetical protein